MFLWLMIAILVAVCSVAGFIYLTRRISAFGFIKKLSKDKKVLKYAISAGLIVRTGGIIWLIWNWINAIMIRDPQPAFKISPLASIQPRFLKIMVMEPLTSNKL